MKILLELRPALDGHAGIPQETRLLFRDVTYFRDAPDNAALPPSELSLLNFRSPQFSGTFIKAYGHVGLFVPDYLADYVSQPKSR